MINTYFTNFGNNAEYLWKTNWIKIEALAYVRIEKRTPSWFCLHWQKCFTLCCDLLINSIYLKLIICEPKNVGVARSVLHGRKPNVVPKKLLKFPEQRLRRNSIFQQNPRQYEAKVCFYALNNLVSRLLLFKKERYCFYFGNFENSYALQFEREISKVPRNMCAT